MLLFSTHASLVGLNCWGFLLVLEAFCIYPTGFQLVQLGVFCRSFSRCGGRLDQGCHAVATRANPLQSRTVLQRRLSVDEDRHCEHEGTYTVRSASVRYFQMFNKLYAYQ